MQSNETLQNENSNLRDKTTMILTLNKSHLKPGIRELIETNRISVYDISDNCFTITAMMLITAWVPRGYSIVFKYGEKTKILYYN